MDHASFSGRWIGFLGCALIAGSLGIGCKSQAEQDSSPAGPGASGTPSLVTAKSGSTTPPAGLGTIPLQNVVASPHPSPVVGGAVAPTPAKPPAKATAKHVVVLSVDGLAPRFLELLLDGNKAPSFAALQKLAAWTHNARTDKTYTITLPNHTCMVTGYPVSPTSKYGPHYAHNYVDNMDPAPGDTLHHHRTPAGSYTSSMFDVAHDNGLRTAMYASKTKFSLFSETYNVAGGPDEVGADNGTKKIDTVVIDVDPASMVATFLKQLQTDPPALSFVHLNQPDGTGHGIGWGTPPYLNAVQQMDALLGQIVQALQSPPLAGNAALIVTADHGGVEMHHANQDDIRNFAIPFYVMAPGVSPGDAYASFSNRFAPGNDNPGYEAEKQPLRNGDAGNLALFLLGLGSIPDSIIHSAGLRVETTASK